MSLILRLCKPWHSMAWALRYGSAMPIRFVLMIASWMWAFLLIAAPAKLLQFHTYTLLNSAFPLWVWGILYAINGALLLWRILDSHKRIEITRLINAGTCALWMSYIYARGAGLGFFPPDTADDIALLLAAIWVTFRTDLTINDRDTA